MSDPETTLGFDRDIRPLFRPKDISSMKAFGHFDLSKHSDVSSHSADILQRLEAGDMPCDAAWPAADVAKFKKWIDDGKNP